MVEVLDATNDVFRHLMDEEVGEIDYEIKAHYLVAGSDKQRGWPCHNIGQNFAL